MSFSLGEAAVVAGLSFETAVAVAVAACTLQAGNAVQRRGKNSGVFVVAHGAVVHIKTRVKDGVFDAHLLARLEVNAALGKAAGAIAA